VRLLTGDKKTRGKNRIAWLDSSVDFEPEEEKGLKVKLQIPLQ